MDIIIWLSSKINKYWYKWDDSSTTILGSYIDLFDHLEKFKIIPYLVFYKTHDQKIKEVSVRIDDLNIQNSLRDIKGESLFNSHFLDDPKNLMDKSAYEKEKDI